jgi:hypothetical protein
MRATCRSTGRPVEVGKHIDRNLRQHETAIGDQNHRGGEDEQPVLKAFADNKTEHA